MQQSSCLSRVKLDSRAKNCEFAVQRFYRSPSGMGGCQGYDSLTSGLCIKVTFHPPGKHNRRYMDYLVCSACNFRHSLSGACATQIIGEEERPPNSDWKGLGPYKNKTIVQGILDRNLRKVRASVVPNVTRETLQNLILKNVKYGSTVYTDDAVAYMNGLQRRFVHDVVNKTEGYVRGQVHVNGMENFWALLKRSLKGTYVAVEPFHLSRYVDEQVFRYNHRKDGDHKLTDRDRFAAVMSEHATISSP